MSGYGYCPWADEDETGLLEEMTGDETKGILGNYRKMLEAGEFEEEQPAPVKKKETPRECAERTNPSTLDLVLKNHPTLSREEAIRILDEIG